MKVRTTLAVAFLVASAALGRADPEPTAAGLWEAKDDDGNPTAWFLFTQKNEVYSARLVKGFKKPGDDTPVKTICEVCPGKKKNAHIMGLTLFYGMKRDGLKYREGSVLDPRDGSVYHALMNLSEDGKDLEVRGYLGMPMFGKSQTWHRLPDDSMKKEDIPKEILAGDEGKSHGDSADKKSHGDVADKGKAHKAKGDKPKPVEKPDAEKADTTPSDAEKAQ